MKHVRKLFLCLLVVLCGGLSARAQYDKDVFMFRGRNALAEGRLSEAVSHFNVLAQLDTTDYWTFFYRGIAKYNLGDIRGARSDFNTAVRLNPIFTSGYHYRAITSSRFGDYDDALQDLEKAISLRPGSAGLYFTRGVTYFLSQQFEPAVKDFDKYIRQEPKDPSAYLNRGGFFLEMGRWDDALADYNKAIELYPDFAKAYMNRAYAELQLGMNRASREDYKTGRRKVAEYRAKNASGAAEFADTTKKYSSLLALDADFAKHDFDDEMLQHRDVDINLKPLYKFTLSAGRDNTVYALEHRYENPLLERFLGSLPLPVVVTADAASIPKPTQEVLDEVLYGGNVSGAARDFLVALADIDQKQYNAAQNHYDRAIGSEDGSDRYDLYYKAFYYMNRAVLRAEMIDFIASIESNVQTLTMDDKGNTRARVREQVTSHYDYSEALADMEQAAAIQPALPYIQFNLGNLYCLSSQLVNAIESYGKAIALYPYMGDAYFNRGLVLIYLKDKEKGCIDLSRAGELGIGDAYNVISRYCEEDRN